MAGEQCGAHAKQSGRPCTKPAGWGTDHPGFGRCRFHGGASPTGKKAAKRKHAEHAVATYGLPREIDPHEALQEELWRTAGHVAWLAMKVRELEEADTYGPVGGGQGAIPEQKPHVWIAMYQAERKHFTDVAKTCVTVGVEERYVRLAEREGELIAEVLQGVARDMGIENDPRLPAIVRKHLTLIAGAA